jgi:GGDEF domain-containing protein
MSIGSDLLESAGDEQRQALPDNPLAPVSLGQRLLHSAGAFGEYSPRRDEQWERMAQAREQVAGLDESVASRVQRNLPFTGLGFQIGTNLQVASAQERIQNNTATEEDYFRLAQHERLGEIAQNRNMAEKIGETVSNLPAFGVEFASGAGAFRAGSAAAQQAVRGTVRGALRRDVVGLAGGALAQSLGTVAGLGRIGEAVTRRQIDPEGVDPRTFTQALPAGAIDAFTETFTERLGGTRAFRAVGRAAGSALSRIGGENVSRFLQTGMSNLGRRYGIHNPLSEILEERAGEAIRGTVLGRLMGERDTYGYTGELASGNLGAFMHQMFVEGAAFTLFSGGAHAAQGGLNRIMTARQGTPEGRLRLEIEAELQNLQHEAHQQESQAQQSQADATAQTITEAERTHGLVEPQVAPEAPGIAPEAQPELPPTSAPPISPGASGSVWERMPQEQIERQARQGVLGAQQEMQRRLSNATITNQPQELGQGPGKTGVESPQVLAPQQQLTREVPQERRQDAAQRRRVAEMTPEELQKELLTSPLTGLPNRRAFEEAPPAPAVAMSDADGLKALNDKFGYEAGNALLRAKADALRAAGLDAYHEKGDEYLYRGGSPAEIQEKLERARQILRDLVIEFEGPNGEIRRFRGADFSYGAGNDLATAEKGLKGHKAEREARGERARGELRGITEIGPEGVEVQGDRVGGGSTEAPAPEITASEALDKLLSDRLDPREQHVIRERLKGRTLEDVAKDKESRKIGAKALSRQRIQKVEEGALEKLGLPEGKRSIEVLVHAVSKASAAVDAVEQGRTAGQQPMVDPVERELAKREAKRKRLKALKGMSANEQMQEKLARLTDRYMRETKDGTSELSPERQAFFDQELARISGDPQARFGGRAPSAPREDRPPPSVREGPEQAFFAPGAVQPNLLNEPAQTGQAFVQPMPEPPSAPLYKPQPKKPSKADEKEFRLRNIVRARGGISRAKVGKDFNVGEDFFQGGIANLLTKKGAGVDDLADELEREGHIVVPPNRNADDYLMELLQKNAWSRLYDRSAEMEAELEAEQRQAHEEDVGEGEYTRGEESASIAEAGEMTPPQVKAGEFASEAKWQGLTRKEAWERYSARDPDMTVEEFGKIWASAKAADPAGIMFGGIPIPPQVLQWFNNRVAAPPPAVAISEAKVPRLHKYGELKLIASNPQGLAMIPGFGKLLDPRALADQGVDQALITRAYSAEQGKSLAGLWAQSQQKFGDLFPVDKAGQVALANGQKGYLSDVIEREMSEPGTVPLTQAQRDWINNEWIPLLTDLRAMLQEEGVSHIATDEGEVKADELLSYFPRPAVGKRTREGQAGMGGQRPGGKSFFQKGRLFKTEREGATSSEGIIYDPNFVSRVSKLLAGAYRAVADQRLADDASLEGKTPDERYELLTAEYAEALAKLKAGSDDRIALLQELRERAAHPIWLKESFVHVAPAFQGKIFPQEIANKLSKAYGESSHDWIRKAERINAASKALMLTLDMSAPFVQGLPLMYSRPVAWAKAVINSYRALLNKNVLGQMLENPQYRTAAQEFVQSGGTIGRLQDYLAGAEEGELATRIPILGRVIKATGRGYGVFLDTAKLEMWRAYRETTPKEQWPAVVEAIENSLGMGRMEQIGVHPGRALGERLMFLAPSYYRAGGAMVANAFQKGVTGSLARRQIGSLLGGVTLTAIGGMLAMGLGWDEIRKRLNPLSGRFLKVPMRLGNGETIEVGFGHIVINLARLAGQSVDYWKKAQAGEAESGMDNPIIRFLRAKAAFLPSLGIDLFTGRDFLGNRVGATEATVRRFEPLVVQQIAHGEGSRTQTAANAVFSFFGAQSFSQNPRDQFYAQFNDTAQRRFQTSYDRLTFLQAAQVAREVERSGTRPPAATPQQIERAMEAAGERQDRLTQGLTADNRDRLGQLSHRLPSYQRSMQVNGVGVPLTETWAQQYEALLIEEYNRTIARWPMERLRGITPAQREGFVQRQLREAKERAQARFRQAVSGALRQAS